VTPAPPGSEDFLGVVHRLNVLLQLGIFNMTSHELLAISSQLEEMNRLGDAARCGFDALAKGPHHGKLALGAGW